MHVWPLEGAPCLTIAASRYPSQGTLVRCIYARFRKKSRVTRAA